MTEENLALASIIFLALLGCGWGFFILFLPQIDRFVERMKKRRAA